MDTLLRRRMMMEAGGTSPTPTDPDGELEWIATDGNSYFNTGYIGIKPRSVKLRCLMPTDAIYRQTLIGCESSTSEPDSSKYAPINIAPGPYRACFAYNYYYTGGSVDVSQAITDGKYLDIYSQIKQGTQVLGVKAEGDANYSTYSKSSTANISTNTYNMWIFGCNRANSLGYPCEEGARLYFLQLFSDFEMTNMLLDYIPYRLNGVVGLMERVRNNFNSGHGTFIAGPLKSQ